MIVILSGITGAGKSYLKKHIINKLNFRNIVIVTTREKRINEIEGIDKHFVSNEEFESLKEKGEICVCFEFLGNKYGYYTKDLQNCKNGVTELHYSTIDEFKRYAKNVISIYIQPKNVDMARKQLHLRNLPKNVEKFRLNEIKEQIHEVETNLELRNKFDYIINNDYTDKSIENAIDLIKTLEQECTIGV